ncbi:histidine kinase [Tumidithrix elongata RA019]|uniref:histidine kinase n=1 Tax=Tumidithrix elongata BACA0141 TaxID=2716417 RepID=A0AAW9PQW6_9CYAN|nr:histidine kinase [Tumidithrix elongata RA019]
MRATPSKSTLQLLLFIDERPSANELVREMEQFLQRDESCISDLQVINVTGQPQLAELFKVVMTPALVKITPPPRQTIAGKNLISQLETCWLTWQTQAQSLDLSNQTKDLSNSLAYSTEVIRLADEVFLLAQDKSDLEEQLRFKDRVIAMLAHDLRNPLTAVSLALETIEISGDKLDPKMTKHLFKHARSQIKVADAMITDILEAGRSSSSEFQIQRQKLRLDQLCTSVSNDFYLINSLEAKQQTFITDIPNDLPLVYADEERIRQVLMNLLGNAIKYTPSGGKIELNVLHRTAQKIEVSVVDNGPGIPTEKRDRVFDDRYRLERDDQADGYGIGLSLCRRIIRAHYGQIWVDDAGIQGSSFHFTLPVY